MEKPTFIDYVALIFNLFDRFVQEKQSELDWYSEKYTYQHKALVVFYMMMQGRQITQFKTQRRWLEEHRDMRLRLGFDTVSVRTTLSRRYKSLYEVIQAFVLFIGQYAENLGDEFSGDHLFIDKSLFKAQGPVWHQSDRLRGRIPDKLKGLDTDASWDKSGYHGWVYGYGVHLVSTKAGFPRLAQVETATYSEKRAVAASESILIDILYPQTLTGDNGYTKAMRIRRWARRGVVLLTPALRWRKGRFAKAYHAYIRQPANAALLRSRQTAIEPFFDLLAQVIGATDNHKQLAIQRLVNVRPCLALGILTIQIAMIANSIWNLPFRSISHIRVCFT